MQGEQEQIKKAAGTVGSDVKNAAAQSVDKAVKQTTTNGRTAKDVIGLTDGMIEGIYGQAYRLYNTGKYRDASQVFRTLLMLNASEVKYAMGLAACFHMLKEYDTAIGAYNMVSLIDPNNPIPFYHASDCYIKTGDILSAIVALEMAVKRSGDRPEFKTIKDRAAMTIEGLKKELNQQAQPQPQEAQEK